MTATGPKPTCPLCCQKPAFGESRHRGVATVMSVNDPNRTLALPSRLQTGCHTLTRTHQLDIPLVRGVFLGGRFHEPASVGGAAEVACGSVGVAVGGCRRGE
jgi:hypothetical protein